MRTKERLSNLEKVIDFAWMEVDMTLLDHLEVSTDGGVRDKKTKRKIPQKTDEWGYQYISLGEQTYLVHHLVAHTWLGGAEITHLDGDRQNNHYLNLYWTSRRLKSTQGRSQKLSEDAVYEIHDLSSEGSSQRELAKKFDVSQPMISGILSGHYWQHVWEDVQQQEVPEG